MPSKPDKSEAPGGPAEASGEFYSPPCYRADVDASYFGYLSILEVLDLLGELLEGERAGARGIAEICLPGAGPKLRTSLHGVARDEGRFCAMLHRHITRLGGEPSTATGAFFDKLAAQDGLAEQLTLLNRGQGWVVRTLRDALPRIEDEALRRDLVDMLDVHRKNIDRCTTLMAGGDV